MAILSGGDIGFDEGGVVQGFSQALEALSKPFYKKTVTTYTYRKGQVATETVKDYSISATTVLVAALLGAGVAVGPKLVEAIKEHWYLMALGPIGVLIIMSLIKSDKDGDGFPDIEIPGLDDLLDVGTDVASSFMNFMQVILDPFDFLPSDEKTEPSYKAIGHLPYIKYDPRIYEEGTSESPSAERFILDHLD